MNTFKVLAVITIDAVTSEEDTLFVLEEETKEWESLGLHLSIKEIKESNH